MVVSLPSDLPLRRSFHVLGPTATSLVDTGVLVAWLPGDVRGFRFVLARDWHTVRFGPAQLGRSVLVHLARPGTYALVTPCLPIRG
jgi:hypothetical protein